MGRGRRPRRAAGWAAGPAVVVVPGQFVALGRGAVRWHVGGVGAGLRAAPRGRAGAVSGGGDCAVCAGQAVRGGGPCGVRGHRAVGVGPQPQACAGGRRGLAGVVGIGGVAQRQERRVAHHHALPVGAGKHQPTADRGRRVSAARLPEGAHTVAEGEGAPSFAARPPEGAHTVAEGEGAPSFAARPPEGARTVAESEGAPVNPETSLAGVAQPHADPNQFALLQQRRFAPFFWTQFLGAANDNLFKFAFTVMVTYQLSVSWLPPAMAGLVIGALFILPFLLFSATSGQFADKYDKTRMIRWVKSLEIAIMLVAAGGFIAGQVPVLLLCTFLMGLHSTLFGPVKYAYLPQVPSERELTGGNGMVEMGTFVAILLGNVAGGLLAALPGVGHASVAAGCVLVALLGRAAAQFVPPVPATDPGLRINWNPFTETWRNLQLAQQNVVVFRSLLGISWMWFFGAMFLSQFPSLGKEVLHGDEQVASLLLVVFSVGIGIGALLCERLSRRHL